MAFTLALTIASIIIGPQSPQDKPPELASAQAYREQIHTARIEWSLFVNTNAPEDCDWYYTSKLAGSDSLEVSRGIADGRAHPQAQAGEPYSYSEYRILLKEGEQWQYYEHAPVAAVSDSASTFSVYRDMRVLGFEPVPAASNVETWVRTAPERYETTQWETDRATISAHWSNGFEVRWTLSPEYGMQPIESVVMRDGEEVSSCVSTYEKWGDFWFPQTCRFTHKGRETARVSILDADFNVPQHARELTPNDLGLIPGIQLSHSSRGMTAWTGSELVLLKDWIDAARAGKVDNSQLEALLERRDDPTGLGRVPRIFDQDFLGLTATVTRSPLLWEEFTRRFIQHCRLDKEQTRKAWQTLKESQKRAYERLPKIEEEAKEHRLQLAELRSGKSAAFASRVVVGTGSDAPGNSKPLGTSGEEPAPTPSPVVSDHPVATDPVKVRAVQIESLEKKLDTIYQPIAFIFEKKLKPELNKLLTPEQKALVSKHDAEVEARRDAAERTAK